MSANGDNRDERPESLVDPLLEALRDAYAPAPIAPELNEQLIESALAGSLLGSDEYAGHASQEAPAIRELDGGSPAALTVTAEELEQARRLAMALDGDGAHPLANLAEALRAAVAPVSISAETSETFARDALRMRQRPKVVALHRWSYAATTLAIAAGAALWVMRTDHRSLEPIATHHEQLVQSRSAAPLFAETLDHGSTTERIDRIYAVRSRELRHNRFATWRVR